MYERDAINAVMGEWFKTLTRCRRRSVWRWRWASCPPLSWCASCLWTCARPWCARCRALRPPPSLALSWAAPMADPAFLAKLGFEQVVTIGGAFMYEAAHRGDRLKAEWDLAAVNIMQLSLANAMTVWCLTPVRSFGAAHKYGWQRVMDSIPNHAFDKSGPLRQYTMATRAASFGVKAMELSALGAITGGVFHGVNKALVGLHKKRAGMTLSRRFLCPISRHPCWAWGRTWVFPATCAISSSAVPIAG